MKKIKRLINETGSIRIYRISVHERGELRCVIVVHWLTGYWDPQSGGHYDPYFPYTKTSQVIRMTKSDDGP